jgi:hypothetical protein
MSRRDFGLGGLRGELVDFSFVGRCPSYLYTYLNLNWETEKKLSIDIRTLGWERIGGVDR